VIFPGTPVSSTNKTDCNIIESGIKHQKPNLYSRRFIYNATRGMLNHIYRIALLTLGEVLSMYQQFHQHRK